jgi:CheY-like chemotaxis protein
MHGSPMNQYQERGMLPFRVLVVDDEEEFVETIVKRLKDRGLTADGVTSGRQALDVLENKDFDVVILIMYPENWTGG